MESVDFVGFPKISRYSRECIVTEKIDGTNARITITESGNFLVGSRTRWITEADDNYGFAKWALAHKSELMGLGVGHHFGEWWGSGIQRNYGMKNGLRKFSLFNVTRWQDSRPDCCDTVPVLWRGNFDDLRVNEIMSDLLAGGSRAMPGFMKPEGIVVFHTKAGIAFKKTFEKDESGKGEA